MPYKAHTGILPHMGFICFTVWPNMVVHTWILDFICSSHAFSVEMALRPKPCLYDSSTPLPAVLSQDLTDIIMAVLFRRFLAALKTDAYNAIAMMVLKKKLIRPKVVPVMRSVCYANRAISNFRIYSALMPNDKAAIAWRWRSVHEGRTYYSLLQCESLTQSTTVLHVID